MFTASEICSSGFTESQGGNCYRVGSSGTWADAYFDCVDAGGSLVDPDTQIKYLDVKNFLENEILPGM